MKYFNSPRYSNSVRSLARVQTLVAFYYGHRAAALCLMLFFSGVVWASAATEVGLSQSDLFVQPCTQSSLDVDPQLLIYQDHDGVFSAQALLAAPELFERHDATRGLGFSKGQVWVRLPIENMSAQACDRWLVVKPAVQEHIVLHRLTDDGDYTEIAGGGLVPVAERPVQTGRFAIFPLRLPPHSRQEVLLSFRGTDAMLFHVKFWSPGAFVDFLHFNDITRYLMLGSISLVLATSIIGAQLQRNPRFLFGGLAWFAALAYQLVRDKYLVYWFPTPLIDPKQLLSMTAALFIGAKYFFVLAYLPSGTLGGVASKTIKYNGILAFVISVLALFVLKPGPYVLHSWLSLVLIAVIVFFAALRVGRGTWFMLGGILVFGLAVQTHIFHTLGLLSIPSEIFDLIAPLAISVGSLLSALAIFQLIVDSNAEINRVQSDLLQQLNNERDQLNQAVNESFMANESKSRFLASVSHDLRQPMYAINLYISTLLRQVLHLKSAPESEEVWDSVSDGLLDLEGSAQYLNVMFEALLDLSRLNAGTMDANIKYVNINRLLSQLESDYARQASELGLRFKLRVPRQFANVEIQTDPVLLERILRNLLVNALRYTEKGGVCLALVVRRGHVEFRVVDTGPGIEAALRERVFDEFFQVPGSQTLVQRASAGDPTRAGERNKNSARDGGIGLGLSISSRLAEKLNTNIHLTSRVGRGSKFYFQQPMRFVLRPQDDVAMDQLRVLEETKLVTKDLYIVVIDDDFEIRRSAQRLLSVLLEADVYTAEDGYKAAAHLGRAGRLPDLVISDYGLLEGDGIQAIETIREEFMTDIPAILITGDTSAESILRFDQSGLKVLYKPITGPELIAAIEEVLSAAATSPKS